MTIKIVIKRLFCAIDALKTAEFESSIDSRMRVE